MALPHLQRMALRHLWQRRQRGPLPRNLLGRLLQGRAAVRLLLHLQPAAARLSASGAPRPRRDRAVRHRGGKQRQCITRRSAAARLWRQLVGVQQLEQARVAVAQRLQQAAAPHQVHDLRRQHHLAYTHHTAAQHTSNGGGGWMGSRTARGMQGDSASSACQAQADRLAATTART